MKKTAAGMPPLQLVENPDILATIAKLRDKRPPLVIGFAAETEHLIDNAKAKLARKGCDWIVANDVSPATGVMGGDRNTVHLLTHDGVGGEIKAESWPVMTKEEVAAMLIARIAQPWRVHSMTSPIKVDVQQLPHAEGLPLPAYQSGQAAGLDLLAAVPERRRWFSRPDSTRWFRPGSSLHCPTDSRRRCGRAPASPPNTA